MNDTGIVVTCLHCGRAAVTFTRRGEEAMDVEYNLTAHRACAAGDEPGGCAKERGIGIR